MTKRTYIATKPLTYATRHLVPGEPFEAIEKHGGLLVAIKKARLPLDGELRRPSRLDPPPPAVIAKATPVVPASSAPVAPAEDMSALREQYATVIGKKAFPGWDAVELRRRMAEAQQS